MKPTAEILNQIRAAAHHDIDQIFDALPTMLDQADAPHRSHYNTETGKFDEPAEDAGIRPIGGHGDPTGSQAFKANPARDWIKHTRTAIRQLHTLTAQVDRLIGPAVCPECHQPLAGRPTKRLNGVLHHDGRCYMAAYRQTVTDQLQNAA